MKILVINGPNLDMLGKRDPIHYGTLTLNQLNKQVSLYAKKSGFKTTFFQSNCEGAIITAITHSKCDAIILNAGAYSHTSYAIKDAIECCQKFVVEVHLSDVSNREDFRKIRVFEQVTKGYFYGKKTQSYLDAVDFIKEELLNEK
ncbi:MAG: 3-dehydroquinate dehydratase [Clostridia bacterium]|nr:3-dehydroquinate dehydratase [Clostridia bacterium]